MKSNLYKKRDMTHLTLDAMGRVDLPFFYKTNIENYYFYVLHTMASFQKVGF